MILTTYTYVPNRKRLDRLLAIKDQTGVPVARQIEFALDYFQERYNRDLEFRDQVVRYAVKRRSQRREE